MNVKAVLDKAISEAGTATAFAAQHKFPKSYLSDVRAGRKAASDRLLSLLGLERVSTIRRKPKQRT